MGFDINRPYRTRDGHAANAIVAPDGRLYGWRRDERWQIVSAEWDQVSGLRYGPSYPCNDDLVNVPENRTVKVWINVYDDGWFSASQTRRDANQNSTPQRIACIEREIEFTVGEGL